MKSIAVFHPDPKKYLEEVLTAHSNSRPVFLGNPHWGPAELKSASLLIPKGTAVEGINLVPQGMAPTNWPDAWMDCLFIPTGGTGGKVKFVIHNTKTLRAAALGLRDALVARGLSPVLHGASFTPPYHVSGLMPVLRAQFTGGCYGHYDGRFLPNQPLPEIKLPAGGTKIASLVHTQISRILEHSEGLKWLKQFNIILLGGAAVPKPVIDAIRNHHLPVYASYGMTETAALCSFCPPEKIWSDEPLRGYPLPGVKFTEINHHIHIHSPANGLGYWLGEKFPDPYPTGDLGHVNADGSVEIHGRGDRIINSGGEKIDPARVEEILRGTGLVKDIFVFGVIDAQWGQRVVACVVASEYNSAALKKAVEVLEPAARPKNYIFVEKIPLDARGKFDRLAAEKLLQI